MGGSLNVESVINQGSSFRFSLWFGVGTGLASSPQVAEVERDYSNINVILVEDNPVNQLVARGQLAKLGVEPIVLTDGKKAFEFVSESSVAIDLVLMDCEMPIMDGYEATRRIRLWENNNNRKPVQIYALTAHVLMESTDKCMAAGMNGKLTKPIKTSDFFPALNSILE